MKARAIQVRQRRGVLEMLIQPGLQLAGMTLCHVELRLPIQRKHAVGLQRVGHRRRGHRRGQAVRLPAADATHAEHQHQHGCHREPHTHAMPMPRADHDRIESRLIDLCRQTAQRGANPTVPRSAAARSGEGKAAVRVLATQTTLGQCSPDQTLRSRLMNDQQTKHAHHADGDGQQGTGGVESGQATSTPNQNGRQPNLGSQPDADSAAGGSGLSDGDSSASIAGVDRIDQVGLAGQHAPGAGADAGADADAQTAATDRLDAIEQADDRTAQSTRECERDIGAQTPGDPGDLLSQPLGEGNYQKQGDQQIPLPGNPDPISGEG